MIYRPGTVIMRVVYGPISLTTSQIHSDPVSPAEAAVLRIAQRETSPQFAGEFEPVTRGFLFAVVCLGALGVLAAFFLVWRTIARAFNGSSR
jgi:hypothetical protein